MSEEAPKKFTNPWLSKGSSHILKSNRPKVPPSPENSVSPISASYETKAFQEYDIRFQSQEENLSVNGVQNLLRDYISAVANDVTTILQNEDKLTDSSVMSEYKTVGLVNECNNCYQNSVIQVCSSFIVIISAFCIVLLSLNYFRICVPYRKVWIIPISLY